nr:hypothetical protein [Vibrio parahaemolyticus]
MVVKVVYGKLVYAAFTP